MLWGRIKHEKSESGINIIFPVMIRLLGRISSGEDGRDENVEKIFELYVTSKLFISCSRHIYN